MNKKNFVFSLLIAFASIAVVVSSCKKDEDPAPLKLVSLVAGDIDMNGAVSPNTVPNEPTIVATFNTNVDATTATPANIKLNQDYDNQDIEINITTSGKTITITPADPLGGGALFELSFSSGLESSDGLANTAFARTFTTSGTFAPAGVVAHWTFENTPNAIVGNWNPTTGGVVDIIYADSRKASAGKAASFNGTTSIIEYPNGDELMETEDFTLSFWFKAMEAGHGHFVIGLAAYYGFQFELNGNFKEFKMPVSYHLGDNVVATGGDLVYNGDGKTKDNEGYVGTTFSKADAALDATLKEKWAHITYVYNNTTRERSFYLNGELVKKQDHDLFASPTGVPDIVATSIGLKYGGVAPEVVNELAFGFVQSRAGTLWDDQPWGGYAIPTANHFLGLLDDVRIFHKPLTSIEIGLMYNSEKP